MLYSFVQHLAEINDSSPFQVFLGDLNDSNLREHGMTHWNSNPSCTLEELAQVVTKHAAALKKREITTRTAQVLGAPRTQLLPRL
jgi:hypothetical protein